MNKELVRLKLLELKNQNIINFSQLLRNAGVNRNNFMLWLNDHDRYDGTKYRVSEKSLQKVIDQLKELRIELKKIKQYSECTLMYVCECTLIFVPMLK